MDAKQEANLKLKPAKCCLMRAQVSFLGYIVSRLHPAKTESMEKWPTIEGYTCLLGVSLILPPGYSRSLDGGCTHDKPDASRG